MLFWHCFLKKKKDDEFTRMKENDTAYLLEHNEFSTQTEVTVCYNGVPFEKNIYSMNHYNSVMLNVSYQKVKRC